MLVLHSGYKLFIWYTEVTVVLQTDINVIHIEPQLVGQLESCPFTFCVTAVMIGGVNRLVDYICISQSDTSTISISSLVQNPSTLSRQQWPNTVVHKFYNCGTCCHETTMAPCCRPTVHAYCQHLGFKSQSCSGEGNSLTNLHQTFSDLHACILQM